MVATYLNLEQAMIDCLRKKYLAQQAKDFESRYFSAKGKLYKEILPFIRAEEPHLTDHSERHIENVLDNIFKLIEPEIEKILKKGDTTLNSLDIYFLCQTALFHDVGNIYGRKFHNQRISKIIDENFKSLFDGEQKRERKIISRSGRAHTGKSSDGSRDTLKELLNEQEHYGGDPVNIIDIAAIVRFADELAEGPQRTSSFMLKAGLFKGSEIYHQYASITTIFIDTKNSRVALRYEINVDTTKYSKPDDAKKFLTEILNYIYKRIVKLNEERQYYNYYCSLPLEIKEIEVTFEIEKDGSECSMKIKPLILNDLVIPGESLEEYSFIARRQDLAIDSLVPSICNNVYSANQK